MREFFYYKYYRYQIKKKFNSDIQFGGIDNFQTL